MGRFLAFQSLIRLLVLPCTLSKLESICLSLLSMSIPSKVKESSQRRGNSGHMISVVLNFEPKGITLVLSRLACSPDILLKDLIYRTHAFNDVTHLSIKSEVSSAKVCALISSSVWRLMPFICLLLVILIRRISTAMIKMNGEIMSPCGPLF